MDTSKFEMSTSKFNSQTALIVLRCKSELTRVLPGVNLDQFIWSKGVFEDGQQLTTAANFSSLPATSSLTHSSNYHNSTNAFMWLSDLPEPDNVTIVSSIPDESRSSVFGPSRGAVKVHYCQEPKKSSTRGQIVPLSKQNLFKSSNLSSCSTENFKADIDSCYERVFGKGRCDFVNMKLKKRKMLLYSSTKISKTDLSNIKKVELLRQRVNSWCSTKDHFYL